MEAGTRKIINQRDLESVSLSREYRPEYEHLKKSLVRKEAVCVF